MRNECMLNDNQGNIIDVKERFNYLQEHKELQNERLDKLEAIVKNIDDKLSCAVDKINVNFENINETFSEIEQKFDDQWEDDSKDENTPDYDDIKKIHNVLEAYNVSIKILKARLENLEAKSVSKRDLEKLKCNINLYLNNICDRLGQVERGLDNYREYKTDIEDLQTEVMYLKDRYSGKTPHKCPKCDGEGSQLIDIASCGAKSLKARSICNSCEGKGIVWG